MQDKAKVIDKMSPKTIPNNKKATTTTRTTMEQRNKVNETEQRQAKVLFLHR